MQHIAIHEVEGFLPLKIEKSKTDQYRDGNEILISKGTTFACPVKMFMTYKQLSGINLESNFYLFRPIFRTKSMCKLIYKTKNLAILLQGKALFLDWNPYHRIWILGFTLWEAVVRPLLLILMLMKDSGKDMGGGRVEAAKIVT